MTIFHINLYNDIDVPDEEGQDFADLTVAKAQAVRSARDIIAEHVKAGQPINLSHRMEITDAGGEVLQVVRFDDVVRIER